MTQSFDEAVRLLKGSRHTTAFSGAGISVESGIPPFRGPEGLWSKYDPSVLDLNRFYQQPETTWKIIRELFYNFFGAAKPNKAHQVLARMEANDMLQAVITQNIDNLHQEAGSRNVWEFHGTSRNLVCTKCDKRYAAEDLDLSKLPPRCSCGGLLKPDFIFFGEQIPPEAHKKSLAEAQDADVFLVIGTTGEIMPASFIPHEAKNNGVSIVEVNTQPSNFTHSITDVFLQGKGSEVFAKLEQALFA